MSNYTWIMDLISRVFLDQKDEISSIINVDTCTFWIANETIASSEVNQN